MSRVFMMIMVGVLTAAVASACDDNGGTDTDADDVTTDVEQEDVQVEDVQVEDVQVEEEVPPDLPDDTVDMVDEDGVEDVPEDTTEPGPPGGECMCDSDCLPLDGQDGICVFGVCMIRASAPCSAAGSSEECPDHLRCWGFSDYEGSICWPDCDTFDCVGDCDADGSCVPGSGMGCDPSCGSYCGGSTGDSPIGGPCTSDADCADAGAMCYPDYYGGEHTGFAEGYCMIFGCPTAGDACGTEGVCVEGLIESGDNICMGVCGSGCRLGYVCNEGYCWPGCSGPSDCPAGYDCSGDICIGEGCTPCAPSTPYGECGPGEWCDEGTCTADVYPCIAVDSMEPNNARTDAVALSPGTVSDLSICGADEDWFLLAVPAGHITQVTLTHNLSAGDLDMVAYDESDNLLGSRYWYFDSITYPYPYRDWETWTETLSFYNQAGADDTYYVRILAHSGESNYLLEVENIPWQDGQVCTDYYTVAECKDMTNLIMFPFADPDDTFLGDNFLLQIISNYRFLRREALMMLRYALAEVELLFPGNYLGVWDLCQVDAITPGYDVCSPRHPETTHDQGGFGIDVAYYQEGTAESRVGNVCGPGETNHDGYFCTAAAETEHLLDLERAAYFQVALARVPGLRIAGYDRVLGPLVEQEIYRLRDDGIITADEATAAVNTMTWGDGWPFHYHHIHVSMDWIY